MVFVEDSEFEGCVHLLVSWGCTCLHSSTRCVFTAVGNLSCIKSFHFWNSLQRGEAC